MKYVRFCFVSDPYETDRWAPLSMTHLNPDLESHPAVHEKGESGGLLWLTLDKEKMNEEEGRCMDENFPDEKFHHIIYSKEIDDSKCKIIEK